MDCLSRLKMDKNTDTDSSPSMKQYRECSAVHNVHMITRHPSLKHQENQKETKAWVHF